MSFWKYFEDNVIKWSFSNTVWDWSEKAPLTAHDFHCISYMADSSPINISRTVSKNLPTSVTIIFNITTSSSGWKFRVEKLLAKISKPENASKVAASITEKDTQNAHQADVGLLTHLVCTIIGHSQRTTTLYKIKHLCLCKWQVHHHLHYHQANYMWWECGSSHLVTHSNHLAASLALPASSRCLLRKTLWCDRTLPAAYF